MSNDGADRGGLESRAEMRAYIEENFLYLHPDLELPTTTTSWRWA